MVTLSRMESRHTRARFCERLIIESMHPFAVAASRGFIVISALLLWLALRRRAPSVKPRTGDGS
jgi:hypothetical protein